MATDLTDATCRECGGSTGVDVTTHVAAPDPHTQYLLESVAAATYATEAYTDTELLAHTSDAGDPHLAAGYLKAADLGTYATEAYADAAVATHAALGNPHPDSASQDFTQDRSGWARYTNTTTTSGAPLVLVAATPTNLPNPIDASSVVELPSDATEFYTATGTQRVTFRSVGELLTIEVRLTVEAVAATDWIDVWVEEVGGATQHGRSVHGLPKGTTAQELVCRFDVEADAGLVANGAEFQVESNATVSVYDIEYLISRSHLTRV